jgi:uncharacterized protein YndB with AHSA1/START domain
MLHDRIEKSAVLHASLERVWQAVGDSAQFGTWFGMDIDQPFVEGATVMAVMTATAVDDEIAAQQKPHAGATCPLEIVTVDPPKRLAFRWNPVPDPEFADVTTLVEFTLTEVDDGVLLEIVESGFEALPASHRTAAFDSNSGGWAAQLNLVGRYVTEPQWA